MRLNYSKIQLKKLLKIIIKQKNDKNKLKNIN